jgi:hypothetical protein
MQACWACLRINNKYEALLVFGGSAAGLEVRVLLALAAYFTSFANLFGLLHGSDSSLFLEVSKKRL